MPDLPQSVFLLSKCALSNIYSEHSIARISELTDLCPQILFNETWQAHTPLLANVEYIFSGWGMATMDEAFLQAVPKLRHVFYGAGTIRYFYTQVAQERGISVSSAWRANALPTADFAHATILLSLKKFFRSVRTTKSNRSWYPPKEAAGTYRSTVGIVALGTIGRRVAQILRDQHQLNTIAYDPFVSASDAHQLGVRLVSLKELFATSDVVSLHAPDLPTTHNMINEMCLRSMKPNATLVNTARGHLVDEAALVKVFQERSDLDAVLDVTATEPENSESPLWNLPNVTISPHIAGSINQECQRMGEYMVEELERILANQPLQHEVTPELLMTMA